MAPITKRKFCALCAVILSLLLLCGCAGSRYPVPDRGEVESTERQFTQPSDGDLIAIFTTSLGEVYYDNTVIWCSEYGFAVQGGDATGTGSGGSTIYSDNPIPLEADSSLRHYAGALCAATTKGDPNSGQSQFYFVTALPDSVDEEMQAQLTENGYTEAQVAAYAAAGGLPYLDNTDTVFGQVYEGMDVVDKMACVDTVLDEEENDTVRPTEEDTITIEKVTIANYPGPTTEELAQAAEEASAENAESQDGE